MCCSANRGARSGFFDLLRKLPANGHAVLLSRAVLPDWLLPLQFSGLMTTIPGGVFTLGATATAEVAFTVTQAPPPQSWTTVPPLASL